jgi:hypothetical protein
MNLNDAQARDITAYLAELQRLTALRPEACT